MLYNFILFCLSSCVYNHVHCLLIRIQVSQPPIMCVLRRNCCLLSFAGPFIRGKAFLEFLDGLNLDYPTAIQTQTLDAYSYKFSVFIQFLLRCIYALKYVWWAFISWGGRLSFVSLSSISKCRTTTIRNLFSLLSLIKAWPIYISTTFIILWFG